MGMPTYVGRSASIVNGNAAQTPANPSGLQTDDILLLVCETANQAITVANPNGGTWTEIADSPQSQGTAGAAGGNRLTVFWSRYNGTQGAPTTSDSGDHQTACIFAFRGVKTSGDPWNVTSGGTQGATTSLSATGDTTTVANCMIAILVSTDRDAASTTNFSSEANASLANLTERADQTFSGAAGGGIYVLTGEKATAGAYGATTATQAASANLCFITVALEGASNDATGSGSPALADVTSSGTGTVLNPVTGSGSPALGNVTSSGSGIESMTGSGSPPLADVTAAGTGVVAPPVTGTGSPSLADVTAAGTGQLTISGSGTPTLDDVTSSGTGTVGTSGATGSGAPVLEDVTSSGSGQLTISGSGSPALDPVTSVGAGTLTIPGTGTPALADVVAAGTGTVVEPVTGSGTPALAAVTAAGTGLVVAAVVGSGAPVLANVTSAGTGIGGVELEPEGRSRRRPQGFW